MFKYVLPLLMMLTSCSWISDNRYIANRDTDYLSAKSIPPLKIPPGMSSSTITAHYPVSEKYYLDHAKEVSLIPPELNP